jgi:hypothetical protein
MAQRMPREPVEAAGIPTCVLDHPLRAHHRAGQELEGLAVTEWKQFRVGVVGIRAPQVSFADDADAKIPTRSSLVECPRPGQSYLHQPMPTEGAP